MTINKTCGTENGMHDFPGSQAEAHSQIVLEQSALYAAKLAIARWINGSSEAAAAIAPAADLARAHWYAETQRNFQEWLGKGGFAQYEVASAELAEPVMWVASASVAVPLADSGNRAAPSCID
jgi:hypothetical protein